MNYNREFLVPYLENICALYFAQAKVDEKFTSIYNEISILKSGRYPLKPYPEEPYMIKADTKNLEVCIFWAVIGFIALFVGSVDGLIGFGTIAAIFLGSYLKDESKADATNKEKQINYEAICDKIRKENAINEKKNEKEREKLPDLFDKGYFYTDEYERTEKLLEQLYSVNIIPNQYRNMYAAVYLYDFFKTSQSTDLERALTLFVLEEIKARLDVIIQQQSEIILNQRIMIANQYKSYEAQMEYNNSMKNKVNQLIANDEEKKAYLEMIENNTRATAYFAAATYLKY